MKLQRRKSMNIIKFFLKNQMTNFIDNFEIGLV